MRIFSTEFQGAMINIFGTIWDPLFKVEEVNKILNMDDINDALKDFDDTYRVKKENDEMLTEQGLYALTFSSKKEVAKELRIMIAQVLKQTRIQKEKTLAGLLEKKDGELYKCTKLSTEICVTLMDTLDPNDKPAAFEELLQQLNEKKVDEKQVECFRLNTAAFNKWADENIMFIDNPGKCVSLKSICKSFLNKESPHSSEMTQIKQSMERYIKKRFNIRPETAEKYKYNQIRLSDSKNKIRGWNNMELILPNPIAHV